MGNADEHFKLEVGAVVIIPSDAVVFSARSEPIHNGPRLTGYIRLKQRREGNFSCASEDKGKVLFVPEGIQPGNCVKITWLADNGKSAGAEEKVFAHYIFKFPCQPKVRIGGAMFSSQQIW